MKHHGLRMPREEKAFTARPKIQSQSQIRLTHWPIFSDIYLCLCLHWVSVVRVKHHVQFIFWVFMDEGILRSFFNLYA